MSIKHLKRFRSVDLPMCCCPLFTAQAPEAYRIADHYRRREAGLSWGGHMYRLSRRSGRHADTVFVGESEELLPLFFREEQQEGHKNLSGPAGIHL